MSYSVQVSEQNGRTVTLCAPSADEALRMARSWLTPLVQPTVGELIKASELKPPTQGVVAQGFEAFGPMGARAA